MNEILELQSGQVSFISGLMAGFSLAVAVQVFRSKTQGALANACFVMFTITSLLFLIGLYIDVALNLRLVGVEEISPAMLLQISEVRTIGTSAATIALFIFIISIGLIGWMQSKVAGIITSIAALITFAMIWIARNMIFFELGVNG
ncbi:MAG: phosphoadenosine phosphosulfate reductase [Pseudomonadota bacterium]